MMVSELSERALHGVPSIGVNRAAPALSFWSLIATSATGTIPLAQCPSILLCGRLRLTSRPDSWFGTASKCPPTSGRDKIRWSGDPSGGGGINVRRRDRYTG
jgi:hypothetical protein